MDIPIWICLPFVLLLLLIAVMPLAFPHFWEKNRNKAIVCLIVSLPALIFNLSYTPMELVVTMEEYISFILMLAALFVISGGILVEGDLQATPLTTTTFMLIGAVIANFIGTTGASMLLIRPLLKTISERKHTLHIPVFFIFIVSNIGGSLTPLGDPPLFLGYIRGVPFTWTFSLIPQWMTAVGILLVIFYFWEKYSYSKETVTDIRKDIEIRAPLSVKGMINLILLMGVVAAVFFQTPAPYREIVFVAMMLLSVYLTKKDIRNANGFTYYPIIEVAVLFAGIFVTMVPLLGLLHAKGSSLGITQPWQFFWVTGGLSSFLDNAPTYVALTSLAESVTRVIEHSGTVVAGIEVRADLLKAISCGAVFMGANTYIGNGPNLMVKAIVEEQGVKAPHFFQYMLYSIGILIPLFLVITYVFFM
ncbi:MAG: sodium:proton antiporter [Desulfobacteraceae bacterium]|nr:sodium:proton antiporter [Desulfobacteraceae bacterium]